MKSTFNEKGQFVLLVNETLSITLEEGDYVYRSGMVSPNNWFLCNGIGNDGEKYDVWYYVENPNETELDEIDYEEPDDICDENGEIIYDKAE